MSYEIYERLARMVEQATTKVKVCVPSTDYYRQSCDFSEDTFYMVDAVHLVSLLEDAAQEARQSEDDDTVHQ